MLNISGTHFSGLFRGEVLIKECYGQIAIITAADTDRAQTFLVNSGMLDAWTENEGGPCRPDVGVGECLTCGSRLVNGKCECDCSEVL